MNFVVLLYQDPATFPATESERQAEWAAYGAFTEAAQADGSFVSGAPVVPDPAAARLVRVVGGKTEVMTGQLPSRPERLVGLYTFSCGSAEEAAAIAARIPVSTKGFCEIVPEMAM